METLACDLTETDLNRKAGESADAHAHGQIPSALQRIGVRNSLSVLWIFMTSERRGSFGASVIDRRRTRAYWAWLQAGKAFSGWIFNSTCRNAAQTIPGCWSFRTEPEIFPVSCDRGGSHIREMISAQTEGRFLSVSFENSSVPKNISTIYKWNKQKHHVRKKCFGYYEITSKLWHKKTIMRSQVCL